MFYGANRGRAREAVALYERTLPNVVAGTVTPLGEGLVRCDFTIGDAGFIAFDSGVDHDFALTPAVSIWVDVESADELERIATTLADGGRVLMPIGDYGFSPAFTWVDDRYGVSWQLAVAPGA